MAIPKSTLIEVPILQELVAVGGQDNIRFLYERLIGYFPQLTLEEIRQIKEGTHKNWRKAVQKAGKSLNDNSYIIRKHGNWSITTSGSGRIDDETEDFALTKLHYEETTHGDVQVMVEEIGKILGFYAELEVEYYDVIWKESSGSARYSHIFEVQSKGNIDSAFAKLKRAYQAQRTKPFLIVSTERDMNRARKSLEQEFQEIKSHTTILTFAQIKTVHQNLKSTGDIISKFLES